MKTFLLKGIIGSLGMLLLIPQLLTVALAANTMPINNDRPNSQGSNDTARNFSAKAKLSLASCDRLNPQESDETARRFAEKAKQYLASGNNAKAAEAAIQAFKAAQTLKNPQPKLLLLEDLVYGNFQPIFVDRLVEQLIASNEKQQAAAVLDRVLQLTQTLSQGHSFVKTKALAEIAKHYAHVGQRERARSILSQAISLTSSIQGAEFKTSALTPIAEGYVAAAEPETAVRILSRSLREAQRIKNPNSVHKVQALQAISLTYAKAGQYDRAIQVAQIIPNLYDYEDYALASIVSQSIKDKQLDLALSVAQNIGNPERKATALATIAGEYAKNQQLEKSSQLFSQAITTAQSVANAYSTQGSFFANIAIQYAEAGQLDAAVAIAQKLEDASTKAKTLAAIALYAKPEQKHQADQLFSQALDAIEKIPEDYQKSNVRQDILQSSTQAGQYNYAVQVAQAIADESSRVETLRLIAFQAVESRNNDLALEIAQNIDSKFIDEKNRALQKIAIAYAKAGQFDKALQVVQQIGIYGSTYTSRAITLAAIATEYHQKGQPQQAAGVFSQALQAANALEEPGSIAQAKAAVALEYGNTEQLEKASELFSEALGLVQTIQDVSHHSYVLREIASYFIQAEQYNFAFQAAQAMKEPSERSGKLQEIADRYIESGEYDKGLQVVNVLNAPEDKAKVLLAIATRYIQTQQPNKARAILAQAFEITKIIPDPESKTLVFKVESDAEGNIISKTEVDDPYDRASFFEDIAIKYAQAGEYNRALQVSQAIQDTTTRQKLRQVLACGK